MGGLEFLCLHRVLLGYLRHQCLTLKNLKGFADNCTYWVGLQNYEKTYKYFFSVFEGNLPEHNLSPTRGRQFEDHVGFQKN